jgi:hypothetical protein
VLQDDPLFPREDLCDLPDRKDEETPAQQACADGDHVRSIEPRRIPHVLDEANPAVR